MYKLENMSFDEAFYAMRHGWGVSRRNGWMAATIIIDGVPTKSEIFFTVENGKLMKYEKLHFGENRWVKNESFMESKDICSNDWYVVANDWE